MTVLGKGNPKEEYLLELAKKFNLKSNLCKDIISKIKSVINS